MDPVLRQDSILLALRPCPLYFIIDESLLAAHEPLKLVRAVLKAGVRVVQLRLKSASTRDLLELAQRALTACAKYDALLIVNDRVDVALLAGAHGVHLGADDAPVAAVRRIAPQLLIGATARTPQHAWAAELGDADYIGCGSVFGSRTKPGLPQIGVRGLAKVDRAVSIPVVGIGGINLGNCPEVLATGVAGVCSVEPFLGGDPRQIVREFTRIGARKSLASIQ